MFGGRKEDFNLNGTPGRLKKKIEHKTQHSLPRKACFPSQQPEHTEWARDHVAGHGSKANVNNTLDRHNRGKEKAYGFDLRIIRLSILSSLNFLLPPPPPISPTHVFINLCCCVIGLMLEIKFNCFHKKWLQVGHKWRFLWSGKGQVSSLTQSSAPWPPSRGCSVYVHLTHAGQKETQGRS